MTKHYGITLTTANIIKLKHVAVDKHTSLAKLVDQILEDWLRVNKPEPILSKPVQVNHYYGI